LGEIVVTGEYTISSLNPTDQRSLAQQRALLQKEGIERDRNLDYIVGLFDENHNMVATGSCFRNTLRCIAVDSSHQGKALLNRVVTHLIEYQCEQGNPHLFLYTRCDAARFFGQLGFHEIARVRDTVVFMENRRDGFRDYLHELAQTKREAQRVAAVVVNANPFTLGHLYLLERASKENDIVHVFVVSEDVSLVPFSVRYDLAKKGTTHLSNLVYHTSGSYMISTATFPSYFLRDEETVIEAHARLDIAIFKKIAASLGVCRRYVGAEPYSSVTSIYNRVMKGELATDGIACIVVPRRETDSGAISASMVRKLIHDGNIEEIKKSVPETTYGFFASEEGRTIVERIRRSDSVIHY
jgi:[citrate (pro-3S)-lyase] ligase